VAKIAYCVSGDDLGHSSRSRKIITHIERLIYIKMDLAWHELMFDKQTFRFLGPMKRRAYCQNLNFLVLYCGQEYLHYP